MQGHLPPDVVRTIRSFLEFYYIARRDIITEDDLDKLQNAISRFHTYRQVFSIVRGEKGFSLPRQHSMVHYPALIRLFAAPNGVCSSLTESKHIRVVKEPWRRSSRNQALFQMLTTNQRLDQLAAARVDFTKRGMLNGTLMESVLATSACDIHFPSILLTKFPRFQVAWRNQWRICFGSWYLHCRRGCSRFNYYWQCSCGGEICQCKVS